MALSATSFRIRSRGDRAGDHILAKKPLCKLLHFVISVSSFDSRFQIFRRFLSVQEKNQKNRSPHHDGGGLLAQVQASVEILSPVPVSGKCGEKDYERLFIREPEVKAREGKMAYVRPEYHDRIMRITRVIGHDRLSLSAYIDHVLTHHFNQCEEAIKSLYARNYDAVF